MNAVEIEVAISDLADAPFDAADFPFQFLECFGHKETAIKRLRAGNSNLSDVPGGVLLSKQIHIAVAPKGQVSELLVALRNSQANTKGKPQFLLATDGEQLEAEDLESGDTIACDYVDFPNHFGFLLPLGGISTVREIKENPIDVRATSRLNKLYVELLRENPEWGSAARQADMNHFMARLVFCFFAEDTSIFEGNGLFTRTVDQMSDREGSNTHEVIEAIFRAMNFRHADRPSAQPRLPSWADIFPYVNGGLFAGDTEVPKFTRTARRFLVHAGALDWQQINPDIFGSMIQAVANAEERSNLGMHYTSVPNILKVLNPLFLDDLREQLNSCGDNGLKLLNLRKRLAKIRVFDPACGSGNFLVIAYKQMREIEAEINRRRNESYLPTVIPLTNFRGIELNSFPAEIARLSLIITEFQCDVLYRGQQDAITEFLPLQKENWIVSGNSLHLDWTTVCPSNGKAVNVRTTDLFEQSEGVSDFDFANEGGETYICGNPPYLGKGKLSEEQKYDMQKIFSCRISSYGYFDYVTCWLIKAADYISVCGGDAAFVTTNSICQGRQAPILWEEIERIGINKSFAHTSFPWRNSATKNAAVICIIVGLSDNDNKNKFIYSSGEKKLVSQISAYLTSGRSVYVKNCGEPLSNQIGLMQLGNKANDGGFLSFNETERRRIIQENGLARNFIKRFYGSDEYNKSKVRYCLWIDDDQLDLAVSINSICLRINGSKAAREASPDAANRKLARTPYKFREMYFGARNTIVIPIMTSVNRNYIPAGLLGPNDRISGQAFGIYDGDLWELAIIVSSLHFVWISTICGRLKEDYRYSNDLGWNTFPVPTLTEQNKAGLNKCAEDILLARETHFPKTIADLYDPESMPENLRLAHERNDEMLERIYIGRRFKNDTERLEKLFDMYSRMTAATAKTKPATRAKRA